MRRKSRKNNKKIIALDFFCGCGGVTHGFRKSGIDVLAGFDNDSNVKYAYERNNSGACFYKVDLTKKKMATLGINMILEKSKYDTSVFAACAPCQPFSMHNKQHINDKRKNLLIDYIDTVNSLPKRLLPDILFCENVGPMKARGKEVLEKILDKLEKMNYLILPPKIIDASKFGVPQNRKRLIFLAGKKSVIGKNRHKLSWEYFEEKYSLPKRSVKDAIYKLHIDRPISAGMAHPKDPLHKSQGLSEHNLRKIKKISKPGGSRDMWGSGDILRCHKDHTGHKDVYGRMSWVDAAPTLTCRCTSISNGRFGHPEQDRAISLREAAILQTLDGYVFENPIKTTQVSKQIGNAVPAKLAEQFGRYIKELVRANS